jgi:cytochrome c-type biogenesis protein
MQGDPATGIGVITALGAGVASFLSPCVLPLVPGYISAVTGVQVADLERADWRRVLVPSLLFVASFSAIFIALGLASTGLGQALRDHRDFLNDAAGVMMIAMGVLFVAALFVVRLNREWHVGALMTRAGRGGPVVAGAAFAIAWTPCVGPTLGAILSAAAISSSAGHGALLLAFYSAGLAIPFLATALAFDRMTASFAAIKRHYGLVVGVGWAILIVTGILVLTGDFLQLNIQAQKLTTDLGINP